MLGTSARLLRLLTLLQARRSWTGAELVERLEVTGRTLRRDVDRLRSLGYPVHSTSGVAGGYRLGAGRDLPPLLLDDEEALAVSLGLRTAASGSVSGMEEVALRALTKLEQVMPERLRRRLTALHASIIPLARSGPTVDAGMLTLLAGACRDHARLSFAYKGADDARSTRRVEPAGLVLSGMRWYLVAWDLARADWRTFRVDRITGRPAAGDTFFPRPPPDGGLAGYVSRSVSQAAFPVRARVLLHAPIAEMATRLSPAAGTLESVDAQSCLFHVGVPSLDALAGWMAALGVEFEVRDPPEARAHLRRIAERVLRAAGRPLPGSTATSQPRTWRSRRR